tara:strand:- start:398 stop:574 length:177 start_codon:yes stop_codon:yes gene_type:complete
MPDQNKDTFIKRLMDKGMSYQNALEEWGIYNAEIDAYKEYDSSKKTNKKAVNAKRKVV